MKKPYTCKRLWIEEIGRNLLMTYTHSRGKEETTGHPGLCGGNNQEWDICTVLKERLFNIRRNS
jgi:hypothetical protein